MSEHGQPRVIAAGLSLVAGLLLWIVPSAATAQPGADGPPTVHIHSTELRLDTTAVGIALPPGGLLKVRGVVTYGPDGSTIDAASEVSPRGRLETGLIDPVASGLELRARDAQSHTYTYGQGNLTGATCQAAGLAAPCIVLRLPQLAAARLRDIGELREELTGTLVLETHRPLGPALVTPPPLTPQPGLVHPIPPVYEPPSGSGIGLFWMAAAGTGAGLVLSLGFLVFGIRRRRKGHGPVARAQAAADRLRRKLKKDPVRARLLAIVNDLAKETTSLAELKKKLEKAVRSANPEALQRRHQELMTAASNLASRGGEEAGQGEMSDAAKIVGDQIERCRRWEMQRWRSAARLERIATRLEALEAELNDPAQEAKGPKQELLDVLQEELELARAGEREAQKLLGGSGGDGAPSSQAA